MSVVMGAYNAPALTRALGHVVAQALRVIIAPVARVTAAIHYHYGLARPESRLICATDLVQRLDPLGELDMLAHPTTELGIKSLTSRRFASNEVSQASTTRLPRHICACATSSRQQPCRVFQDDEDVRFV
jgi:hypothetical protein